MTAARLASTTASDPLPIAKVARRVGYSNFGSCDAHYLDVDDRLPEDDLADAEDVTSGQQ